MTKESDKTTLCQLLLMCNNLEYKDYNFTFVSQKKLFSLQLIFVRDKNFLILNIEFHNN